MTRTRHNLSLAASITALVLLACDLSPVTPANPNPGNPPPTLPAECGGPSYPCAFAEVLVETLERGNALLEEVARRAVGGEALSDIHAWLQTQAGVTEVQSDRSALCFRLGNEPAKSLEETERYLQEGLLVAHKIGAEQSVEKYTNLLNTLS